MDIIYACRYTLIVTWVRIESTTIKNEHVKLFAELWAVVAKKKALQAEGGAYHNETVHVMVIHMTFILIEAEELIFSRPY